MGCEMRIEGLTVDHCMQVVRSTVILTNDSLKKGFISGQLVISRYIFSRIIYANLGNISRNIATISIKIVLMPIT